MEFKVSTRTANSDPNEISGRMTVSLESSELDRLQELIDEHYHLVGLLRANFEKMREFEIHPKMMISERQTSPQ